ncbi:MAG: hypothetical protein H7Z19_11900, partial [Chitinophagaceae bacterium]|nr:hypothetical protein [Rubrivivax sp.]
MRALTWAGVALGLALLTAVLHGSAVGGGWRFDDAPHLQFVATYSPWQYFGVREVMLRQSYAHITPWNALFYEIGLPWFGLDARGHHVHLLVVLWATALASFALLQRWLHVVPALAGAVLFLAMPPTAVVGQLLMTGHYAYGLLFSVLSLHCFAGTLQRSGARPAWLAAFFYALACLCKELYVPLVLVTLALPLADVRARL